MLSRPGALDHVIYQVNLKIKEEEEEEEYI